MNFLAHKPPMWSGKLHWMVNSFGGGPDLAPGAAVYWPLSCVDILDMMKYIRTQEEMCLYEVKTEQTESERINRRRCFTPQAFQPHTSTNTTHRSQSLCAPVSVCTSCAYICRCVVVCSITHTKHKMTTMNFTQRIHKSFISAASLGAFVHMSLSEIRARCVCVHVFVVPSMFILQLSWPAVLVTVATLRDKRSGIIESLLISLCWFFLFHFLEFFSLTL